MIIKVGMKNGMAMGMPKKMEDNGEESTGSASELVQAFYCLSVSAHAAHVNTRSFAKHEALGEFYSKVNDFKDRLVEYMMGMGYISQVELEEIEMEDVMEEAEDACYKLEEFATSNNDEALINMAGEFREAKGKLKYLMMFS